MQTQIDLAAFANYALNAFDFDANFEDDQFAVTWDGARIYVERKKACFLLHVGTERHQLPR